MSDFLWWDRGKTVSWRDSGISNLSGIDRFITQIFRLFLETFFSRRILIKNRLLYRNQPGPRKKNGANTYFKGPQAKRVSLVNQTAKVRCISLQKQFFFQCNSKYLKNNGLINTFDGISPLFLAFWAFMGSNWGSKGLKIRILISPEKIAV